MQQMREPLGLKDDFAVPSPEAWRAAAEALLKGAPFEKSMTTPTYEGFSIQPIYDRDSLSAVPHATELPGQGLATRAAHAGGRRTCPWRISQELFEPTPRELNAVMLHELERGQDELNLWFDAPTRAGQNPSEENVRAVGRCGVSLATFADMETLFKGVRLDAISTWLRAGAAPAALAALFFEYVKSAGIDLAELKGCLESDPIGLLVAEGSLKGGLTSQFDQMEMLMRFGREVAPGFQMACAQGHVYHDGGASSSEELACVLATAVAYLREMKSRGLDPDQVAPRIRLSLSVGSDFFLEIAKIRAARMLWNRIQEILEIPPAARTTHLHVRTGLWNKTKFDAHTGMLRVTSEAFAAVLGGCDSLHIGTFDEVVREPDAFSRRIARNVHPILAEECDLTKVVDPAGGSWALENLTDQMARTVWEKFQEIEKGGGMVAALRDGMPQHWVAKTRAEKLKNFHRRKDVLVGTNQYPEVDAKLLEPRTIDYAGKSEERIATVKTYAGTHSASTKDQAIAGLKEARDAEARMEAAFAAVRAGATLGDLSAALEASSVGRIETVEAIPFSRLAEDYEILRLAAMKAAEAPGGPPRILQLNIGASRRYRMRADWTAAFFLIGGFAVDSNQDFPNADAAVAAVREEKPRIAVITSDDETYASVVPGLAKAIKEAAPGVYLLLAGHPGSNEAAWREAGVEDFIHVRVNNYEVNRALLQRVGVLNSNSID